MPDQDICPLSTAQRLRLAQEFVAQVDEPTPGDLSNTETVLYWSRQRSLTAALEMAHRMGQEDADPGPDAREDLDTAFDDGHWEGYDKAVNDLRQWIEEASNPIGIWRRRAALAFVAEHTKGEGRADED